MLYRKYEDAFTVERIEVLPEFQQALRAFEVGFRGFDELLKVSCRILRLHRFSFSAISISCTYTSIGCAICMLWIRQCIAMLS